ncbi:DUF1801 domain-containing protein [bacterium]|nr:MAG: DUF1801 domain-containing protein [bacterium]
MNPTETIDQYIVDQDEWQSKQLATFRKTILSNNDVSEAWKWNVPVFMVGGKLVCAMSTFKNHIKFNFFEGATLADRNHLFNSGLDSKQHRSINTSIDDQIDWPKLEQLIDEAIAHAKFV